MPNLGNDSNVHYVKFIRGTLTAWNNLLNNTPEKISDDTLYFIYENPQTSYEGKLYLGKKLISGYGDGSGTANININDIGDVVIGTEPLADQQILVYNDTSQRWENTSLSNIIQTAVSVMRGASTQQAGASGLVPQPLAGDENKFLKGNGTWSFVPVPSVDTTSITFNNNQLTIVGFQSASVGSVPIKTNAGIEWSTNITGTLNRQIITLENLQLLIQNNEANENMIYMVPNGNDTSSENGYDEYMIIGNRLERLGTFGQVNLNNYVQLTVFNSTIESLNNILQDHSTTSGQIIPGLVSRVENIELNYIKKTDIGDLNSLILSSNNTTLVEEVNTINERIKWHELIND